MGLYRPLNAFLASCILTEKGPVLTRFSNLRMSTPMRLLYLSASMVAKGDYKPETIQNNVLLEQGIMTF